MVRNPLNLNVVYNIPGFFLHIGILPRDGKNIPFKEVAAKIYTTYNFAPSYCLFVSNFAAKMMKKNYGTDTFDLAELNLHSDKGGIEYDGSMTRKLLLERAHTMFDNDTRYIFQAKIVRLIQIKQNRTPHKSRNSWPLLQERTRQETLS